MTASIHQQQSTQQSPFSLTHLQPSQPLDVELPKNEATLHGVIQDVQSLSPKSGNAYQRHELHFSHWLDAVSYGERI
ncbi:hypothetical protein RIF29_06814 [Crotalaria pallida]|uniref:Uncharacterized protein n=1 Tax=Crotalaria pallida TaxID=3830 RepID=A0AAN9J553_CROPI